MRISDFRSGEALGDHKVVGDKCGNGHVGAGSQRSECGYGSFYLCRIAAGERGRKT